MQRVVIVTGAASGIGAAIASKFANQGWSVFTTDLKQGAPPSLSGDVGDPAHVRAVVAKCRETLGGVDCLVNNAGRMGERKAIADTTLDDWSGILRTNLTGAFLLAKECAALLAERQGSIINIGSTRATQSEPNTFAYSASKGGLLALTHSLAVSLAPVRANCISPGWIDTVGEPLREVDHEQHPAGRVGRPEDVADLALYLAQAGFVTGAEFVIDGGMTRKMIYAED